MSLDSHPRILCGVDESAAAANAARWAVDLASRTGGELVLLHAYHGPPVAGGYLQPRPPIGPTPAAELRTEVGAAESAVAEAVASRLDDPAPRTMTVQGDPAVELIAAARDLDADCIIVGRDRGTLGAAVLGSVSSDVIGSWDGPVMVIGADATAPARDGVVLAGLAPEHAPAQVAREAARLAKALGTALVLGHIAPDPPLLESLAAVGSADRLQRLSAGGEEHRWLHTIAEDLEMTGVDVEAVVRYGHPARELPALAEDWSVSATAVGSRRRGPLRSAVMGSTSSAVLSAATAPVLIASPA